MSRHRLRPRAGYQGYEIAVGWDRALGSFYAQVFTDDPDATADQGGTHLWLGAAEPVTDAATVVEAVRRYAEVSEHLTADLKADSARECSRTAPGLPHAAATAIEQFRAAIVNDHAEAAVTILHELIATRNLSLVEQVIGWAIDHRLRELTAGQLAEAAGTTTPAIYGLAISSPAGTHYALAAPDRLLVGLAHTDRSRLRALPGRAGMGTRPLRLPPLRRRPAGRAVQPHPTGGWTMTAHAALLADEVWQYQAPNGRVPSHRIWSGCQRRDLRRTRLSETRSWRLCH